MRALFALAFILAIGPAQAAGNPWTEADGKDRIFLAWKRVKCGDTHIRDQGAHPG